MAKRKTTRRTTTRKTTPTRSRSKKSQSISLPPVEIKSSTKNELYGIVYILIALVAVFSILGVAGPLGSAISMGLTFLFGIAVWVFPIVFGLIGFVMVLYHRRYKTSMAKILGILIMAFCLLGYFYIAGGTDSGANYVLPTQDKIPHLGGWVGFIVGFPLYMLFKQFVTKIILIFGMVFGAILFFDFSLRDVLSLIKVQEKLPELKEKIETNKEGGAYVSLKKTKQEQVAEAKKTAPAPAPKKKEELKVHMSENKPSKKTELSITLGSDKFTDWKYPSLELLDGSTSSITADPKLLKQKAAVIEQKLSQFGIDVNMEGVHLGPTVMQYTLRPADGVKLSKITTLKNDLALALSAESLRIEAPIPGKGLVGIEVPNEKRAVVRLRELLISDEFNKKGSTLKLPIGRSADGSPIIGDLTKMPHLLIAGQTGSGKSVAINEILISLLYQNSPADLRMILVDPKRVELSPYNSIPHLLTPVIVEPEKTIAALRWAVNEMTRRYKMCAENHVRNLSEYNEKNKQDKLPYIVIVIDELADLMMVASKEVEALICRIAQMARAVGIHLIIATQRPSVDVITGLIKANIPTRLAFTVASGVDSRTIIDSIGAEDLLGMGDGLYLTSDIGKPIRVQGVYLSTEEVNAVTQTVKLTREPEYITEEITEVKAEETNLPGYEPVTATGKESDDEMVEKAIAVIRETRKASASLLQRRLNLGYARAARMLDILEEKGVVGPSNGAKPREIFLPEE